MHRYLPRGIRLRLVLAISAVSIAAVAFAPDGRSLLTAGADRMLRLWPLK